MLLDNCHLSLGRYKNKYIYFLDAVFRVFVFNNGIIEVRQHINKVERFT